MNLPASHPKRAKRDALIELRVRCGACHLPSVRFIHEGAPTDPCAFCGSQDVRRI